METTPTGTSLEVLAPYLPYEIEVELLYSGLIMRKGDRFPLLGIDTTEDYPVRTGNQSFKPEGVLPVLKPFSALCDPLPDGTVPAIEVARLLARPPLLGDYELRCERTTRGEAISVYIAGEFRGHLAEEWEAGGKWTILKVANYLRSKHFAVGLAPHQYLPTPSQGQQTPQTPSSPAAR